MTRAVLDANIYVSALICPSGSPGRIVRSLVEDQTFALVLSADIAKEVERALLYPRVRKRIQATDDEVRQWVSALTVIGDVVTPTAAVSAVADDPDDNKYVAAALAGRADYIVSGDSHLLDLETYRDIRNPHPAGFPRSPLSGKIAHLLRLNRRRPSPDFSQIVGARAAGRRRHQPTAAQHEEPAKTGSHE